MSTTDKDIKYSNDKLWYISVYNLNDPETMRLEVDQEGYTHHICRLKYVKRYDNPHSVAVWFSMPGVSTATDIHNTLLSEGSYSYLSMSATFLYVANHDVQQELDVTAFVNDIYSDDEDADAYKEFASEEEFTKWAWEQALKPYQQEVRKGDAADE